MTEINVDNEDKIALRKTGDESEEEMPAINSGNLWEDKPMSPEHKYMRDLIYDAKSWREDGQPKFERITLTNLKYFLDDYLQNFPEIL